MVNTNDSVNFKCPASDKLKVYMVSERHYTNCEIEEGTSVKNRNDIMLRKWRKTGFVTMYPI